MQVVAGVAPLREALKVLRAGGRRVALVPTMGNLHDGHLSLFRRAAERAEVVVGSIFVNPLQFGPDEDFEAYPRTLERDRRLLEEQGVDLLFSPETDTLYPRSLAHTTHVEVPELGDILCGASRPGHFRGVATVVNLLFNLVAPEVAVFGEKDYQQLAIIRRMVGDLHMPIEVLGVATRREADGLAMSSRNAYLDATERRQARLLARTLADVRARLLAGKDGVADLERWAQGQLQAAGFRPDYVSIRRAPDLAAGPAADEPRVILAAAWLGRTRLIDNLMV